MRLAHITEEIGFAAKLDIYQAKAVLADATVGRVRAKNAFDVAKASLVTQLGLPAGTEVEIVAPKDLPTAPDSSDDIIAAAVKNRPEIRQLFAKRDQIKAQMALIRLQNAPTLTLQANYGDTLSGAGLFAAGGTTVNAVVGMRLFDGGQVNAELDRLVPESCSPQKNIYSAMRYSLIAGGKRLRPVLALAVCEMLGDDPRKVLPFACAIEMIHTYSLIHDDLPAMDNDDYRRGGPTNHKVFGEGTAILAGDALLNQAFEVMLENISANPTNALKGINAMGIIAKAAGASGMIGGQVVDLESEGKDISKELLLHMYRCKTGALIKAPVLAAAVLCGADVNDMNMLEQFGNGIGLAFQVKDDILDIEGSSKEMGKNCGSDISNDKSTFVSLYGLEESKRLVCELTDRAADCINGFGEKAVFLKALTEYLTKREK
jgi:geranylgeranyl diphosphate synthase type II